MASLAGARDGRLGRRSYRTGLSTADETVPQRPGVQPGARNGRATELVAKLGGGMVATLPLLAAFLDEPFEPGPYSPASRLFWNEFYLDVLRIPELRRCPSAQALLQSSPFLQEVRELKSEPLVEYH